MKLTSIYIPLIIISFFYSGCQKDGSGSCFKRAKSNATIQLALNDFNAIALYDDINLEVTFDSLLKVELTGPSNLLEFTEIKVANNTLIAENNTKCYVTKGYNFDFTLKITLPSLDSVYTDGYGNITFLDTLKQPGFKLENFGTAGSYFFLLNTKESSFAHHLGTADIEIKGKSDIAKYFLGSNGRIEANNFKTKQSFVNQDGDGNMYVNASDYLSYSISSYGDLYVFGNPANIEGNKTGKGSLILK